MAKIDFDLRQLEIYCWVVDLCSFSKAATALSMAQASVSERISTLEKAVGARLLDRSGRTVTPTAAGELLHRHARDLLDLKGSVAAKLERFLDLEEGEVGLGASTIPGEYILPGVIGSFRREYPKISVGLEIASTARVENRVLNGAVELGVVGSRIGRQGLEYSDLWQDRLVVAVPPDHRWAGRNEVSPDELTTEPFISRGPGSGTLRVVEKALRAAGAPGPDRFQVVARFGSSTAVKEGIRAGLGYSILSARAVETEVRAGLLATLTVKALPITRTFHLVRDSRRTPSPSCRAMIDFLKRDAG